MTNEMPRIPASLKRTVERKPRAVTVLPTTIQIGDELTVIADIPLQKLIDMRAVLKQQLADVPRLELELRSVIAETKRKLKE